MNKTRVIERAGEIQVKANEALTLQDKKEQIKYSELIKFPEDKIYLMRLMDESTQITNKRKLVKRIKFLQKKYGMLHFLSPIEKMLFNFFIWFGELAPGLSVPAFQSYLRATTAKAIVNEKPSVLKKHLSQRYKDKIGQNVNLIGEVVLGEEEATRRYNHYLEALEKPEINYMSIKLSGIFSQIHPLNYDEGKKILIERMSAIYRKAMAYPVKDAQGNMAAKFINLDMEEYKDVELTYDVFTETLEKEEFKTLRAGVVLQAYIPDSCMRQKRLVEWAQKRIANGGAPIKMRLVKGANLQMETVISSSKHWPNPVLDTKTMTDANYLKMIDYGFQPEHAKAVNMGIASHNLFSIAYAQIKAEELNVEQYVEHEMLEGMANNLVRAMGDFGFPLTLYAPVVTNEHFLNAVSYLVRRLDENTGEENFIAHSFNLEVDDNSWQYLKKQFDDALAIKDSLSEEPKRQQNLLTATYTPTDTKEAFHNEADTDFDLPANYQWSKNIAAKWKLKKGDKPFEYFAQIGSQTIKDGDFKTYIDPSQEEDIQNFKVGQASPKQVEEIIAIAKEDKAGWRDMTEEKRHVILAKVANKLRENRGDLIGVMSACTGKTIMEGDVEVSEAIDFTEFYPRTAKAFFNLDNITLKGKGVVLVIPPWNFPLAIPVGGVIAGLSAGNTVIIKPATAAAPVAFHFVNLMHEAGVPKEALQVVLPAKRASLNVLTGDKAIKHIIFTGGTETVYNIAKRNPKTPIAGETGGKNAIIVTSSADKDIAVASAIQSAFYNAGQKCSACSLLLLQKDIYDDPIFIGKLKDACESAMVGSPWDLPSLIGPMIAPDTANKALTHAIENLESGESWLVKPKVLDKRRLLMHPGIKMGVKKDNYTFKTELFAPLLAVVKFDNLDEAIDMVNSTGYGLTSGLHSLDEREQLLWQDKIEAGNLYINRGITGAIVQRQPFGGMKESAFGNGIKAGGPNYVSCFMTVKDEKKTTSKADVTSMGISSTLASVINACKEKSNITAAVESYRQYYDTLFSQKVDFAQVVGEDNYFRYIPAMGVALRVRSTDKLSDILKVAAGVEITGTKIAVSVSPDFKEADALKLIFSQMVVEDDATFNGKAKQYKRLRLCGGKTAEDFYTYAAAEGVYLANTVPLQCGRLELLNYLQEQSITTVYHRYGNLGDREIKE